MNSLTSWSLDKYCQQYAEQHNYQIIDNIAIAIPVGTGLLSLSCASSVQN